MSAIRLSVVRPSWFQGMFYSFLFHAGTISAAYFWWTTPVAQFSFSGRRDAIRIQLAFMETEPDESLRTRLTVESTLPLDPTASPGDANLLVASDIFAQPLSRPRSQVATDRERPWDQNFPPEEFGLRDETVALPQRCERPTDTAIPALEPLPQETRLTRHAPEIPSPQTTTRVEVTAGMEDSLPPDFSANRPPSYPVEAIRQRLEGTVLLRLHINASGRVEQVDVVATSGHPLLDQSARKAVLSWRGRPARRGGVRIATVQLLPVHFKL